MNNENVDKDIVIKRLNEEINKITNDHIVNLSSYSVEKNMLKLKIEELGDENVKMNEIINNRKKEKIKQLISVIL